VHVLVFVTYSLIYKTRSIKPLSIIIIKSDRHMNKLSHQMSMTIKEDILKVMSGQVVAAIATVQEEKPAVRHML